MPFLESKANGETMLVKARLLILMLVACGAAACSQGPSKSSPPMITMSVESQAEYDSAAAQATEYCEKNYELNAQVMGEWTGKPGDITFVCQP